MSEPDAGEATESLSLSAAQYDVIEIAHSHYIKVYEDDRDGVEGVDDVVVLGEVMDRLDRAHPGIGHDEGVTVDVTPGERAAFERMVRTFLESGATEDGDEVLASLVE